MGGLCDFIVTPVPIGLGFQFLNGLGLVLGLGGLDLGLGLDNSSFWHFNGLKIFLHSSIHPGVPICPFPTGLFVLTL